MNKEIKRGKYLLTGSILALFLGLIYAWSLFVSPIEADLGFNRAETSLTFTISMSCFSLGCLIGGIALKKRSPRLMLRIGAVFVSAGLIVCSQTSLLIELFLSYGVVLSFGIGLTYISTLNVVSSWYRDKVGTASGIMLMGFGLGSFVLGGAATFLFDALGWRTVFFVFAIVFGVLIFLCSFLMCYPDVTIKMPQGESKGRHKDKSGLELTPFEMIRRWQFWVFFIWSVLALAIGLSTIGNAATFASSIGAATEMTVIATGVMSVSNGLGRILLGSLFDTIGQKLCMLINGLLFTLGMSVLMTAALHASIPLLLVGYVCTGLALGGIPTINSALGMSYFGAKYYATNVSVSGLSIIPGALLGPFVAGLMLSSNKGYEIVFLTLIIVSLGVVALGLILKKPTENDRF